MTQIKIHTKDFLTKQFAAFILNTIMNTHTQSSKHCAWIDVIRLHAFEQQWRNDQQMFDRFLIKQKQTALK